MFTMLRHLDDEDSNENQVQKAFKVSLHSRVNLNLLIEPSMVIGKVQTKYSIGFNPPEPPLRFNDKYLYIKKRFFFF